MSKCSGCGLVFVLPDFHLSPVEERDRYLLHRNSCQDPGYLNFLEQLIAPVVARLQVGSEILDFGSGPSPVMATVLKNRGFNVTLYDTNFALDQDAICRLYNGVICCETAEHFRVPRDDWTKMTACTSDGGLLAVMTLQYDKSTNFSTWWYAQDPTHVCFYSRETFSWIAAHFGFELEFLSARVSMLTKK